MATTNVPSTESIRHLRSRDGGKRSLTDSEAKSPTDEDAEMAAATTASHYLGCRMISTKRKLQEGLVTIHTTPKRPKVVVPQSTSDSPTVKTTGEGMPDVYCWECHKECVEGALDCVSCPRTFHPDCLPSNSDASKEPSDAWTCPVCLTVMKAECADSRSWAMQQVNIDQLCTLFGFALQRMKHPDSEAFHNPVPKSLLPDYYDIVFHPMDLSTLERNIKRKMYASTEAFLEDAKWILHNSMIYNGATSKYTADAKMIIKICKHEMSEIELCPDCYMNSCIRKDNWFAEPCTFPHCLVWAKLKGFPYWPAKALRVSNASNVDVRFFGAHDRAWIPMNQVFLLSEECPNPIKNVKKYGLDKAVGELQLHLEKLRTKPNVEFRYAPGKTEFKVEHLYNCSMLFGTNLTDEQMSTPATRAAHERRRHVSGEESASVANSEDLSERSMISSSFDATKPERRTPPSSGGDNVSVTTTPFGTPLVGVLSPGDSPRKSYKAKKQIGRSMPVISADDDSDHIVVGKIDRVVEKFSPPIATDEDRLSVLEKLRSNIAAASRDEMDEEFHTPLGVVNFTPPDEAEMEALEREFASKDDMVVDGLLADTSMEDVDKSANVSITDIDTQMSTTSSYATAGKTSLTPPNVQPESSNVRKRNLQSVLEKMKCNVLRCSVSPVSHDQQQQFTTTVTTCASASESRPFVKPLDTTVFVEKYTEKINSFLHSTMECMVNEVQQSLENGNLFSGDGGKAKKDQASAELMQEQLGKMKWFYQEAIRAMKNTAKVTFTELQQSMEAEKDTALDESRRLFEEETAVAVKEAKLKQWCANCGKEAVFYCCWNTSYCDYPCQQRHWPKHQSTCAQIRQTSIDHGPSSMPNNFLPPQFTGGQTSSAVNNSGGGVIPAAALYALPTAGPVNPPAAAAYYKTANMLPPGSSAAATAIALDLNSTNGAGQFVAIQPRMAPMTSSSNVSNRRR